jgi:tRNA modification GTPase
MNLTDTILAVSSPPITAGHTLRTILRLSGPHAWQAAANIIPIPTTPHVGWHSGLPIPLIHPTTPLAAVLLFRSPKSFTGDDIAELHLPASPAMVRFLSDQLLQHPHVRPATPGEFSARAFFNGKIDLTQAEGIAATINAANESQLKAAASLRSGDLHQWIASTAEKIATLLASVEAGIDFSDEEGVSFIGHELLRDELSHLLNDVLHHQRNSRRLESYDELPTVVLTGRPNVGKSSLLNTLTNSQRAIVSPVAGTTRDALFSIMATPIGDIRLVDVAGIETSSSPLAAQMNAARQQALSTADLILHVDAPDVSTEFSDFIDRPEAVPTLRVFNKCDLQTSPKIPVHSVLFVSAKTGEGIDHLRARIQQILEPVDLAGTQRTILNQRHRDILSHFDAALQRAYALTQDVTGTNRHPELLAAELRTALDLLGQITGTISPDDILGRIFSSFCIGK